MDSHQAERIGTRTPLRIALLSALDPMDRRSWSGTMHYMAESLAVHAGHVIPLGPVDSQQRRRLRSWSDRLRPLLRRRYKPRHSIVVAAEYARVFAAKLRQTSADVIFAPAAATEIALLKTNIPIVYLSDATFAAVAGYFEDFSDLLALSYFEGNLIERYAIRTAAHIIYSSAWGKESAIRDYGADPRRLSVIPFGANIEEPPSAGDVLGRGRATSPRLLFVGVDWERKGGPIALEALRELERLGLCPTLTVVGCQPQGLAASDNLTIVPFLNKNHPADRKALTDLYLGSDIFIMPTRAECSAISFCEAAAYGLPVVSAQTGGVPSVVRNGITGLLFPPDAGGAQYAAGIAEVWRDRPKFEAMAASARRDFDLRLNWSAWGAATSQVLLDTVNRSVAGLNH